MPHHHGKSGNSTKTAPRKSHRPTEFFFLWLAQTTSQVAATCGAALAASCRTVSGFSCKLPPYQDQELRKGSGQMRSWNVVWLQVRLWGFSAARSAF